MAGYEISEPDFRQIIAYGPWQDIARPLLRQWFGYEIDGQGEAAKVRSATGDDIDLGDLHRRIQTDPQVRYDIYQRAMNVWR